MAANRFVLDANRVVRVFTTNKVEELPGIERLGLLEDLFREA
jgi:hypothetical protein